MENKGIETGTVIRIKTAQGEKLAVIQGRKRLPTTQKPQGYFIWIEGKYDSIPEEAIIERYPICLTCGRAQWSLALGKETYRIEKVICSTCYQKTPQWEVVWESLSVLMEKIPEDNALYPSLQGSLELCDIAFQQGNWPLFTKGAYAISLAIALKKGLWNPFEEKA